VTYCGTLRRRRRVLACRSFKQIGLKSRFHASVAIESSRSFAIVGGEKRLAAPSISCPSLSTVSVKKLLFLHHFVAHQRRADPHLPMTVLGISEHEVYLLQLCAAQRIPRADLHEELLVARAT